MIDVKLLPSFFLPSSPFLNNIGAAFHWACVQRSYQWNGISSLASWTYLHFLLQFWSTWQAAKPRTAQLHFHFTVATICVFTETMSPIIFFDYFAETMSPIYSLIILENHRRNLLHRCHYFCIFNLMLLLYSNFGNLIWTPFDNIGCSTSFSRSTTRGSTVSLMA